MQNQGVISGALIVVFLLSGCASIVSKNVYPVTFDSHPDAATIIIKDEDGKQIYKGKTPTTLSLPAGEAYFHAKTYTVTFSKPGYEERTTEIKAGLDGWYIGNLLFGGLIGFLIVDPLTGNMWKLPTETTVTLPEQVSSVSPDRGLKIVTIDQIPESFRKGLIRVN